MQKIYTKLFNLKMNWRADVAYPFSLFSMACFILLLSSFGTKASIGNDPSPSISANATVVADFVDDETFTECCSRTVLNMTPADHCYDRDEDYFMVMTTTENVRFRYFGTNFSWEECDDGTLTFTGIASANDGSHSFDLVANFSGGTSTPPNPPGEDNDSPIGNHCAELGDLYYYPGFNATLTDRVTGAITVLTRRGPAFQFGENGNDVASGFGASGWFHAQGGMFSSQIEGDLALLLGETCTPLCTRMITINNNGTCPLGIYRSETTGDVYETLISAGSSATVTTAEGVEWRATDAPEADPNNLLFDMSYVSSNDCVQSWDLNPTYCAQDCTPSCGDNDICDAIAAYTVDNANPTCLSGNSGVLFTKDCTQEFVAWQSNGNLILYEFSDGSAKILGTVTSGGNTGHIDICLDSKSNNGKTYGAQCYTSNLSNDRYYYNCFAGTITVNGQVQTIHKRGSSQMGAIIANGAGNDGSGLGLAAWTGGSAGNCSEWFSHLTPIDVECCETFSIEASADVSICENENVTLSVTLSGENNCSANEDEIYEWTAPNGAIYNTETLTVNTIGTYSLVVTDCKGCQATDQVIVFAKDKPAPGISAQDQVCAGEDAQFSAVPPVVGATYAWEFTGPATPTSANTAVAVVSWADVPGDYTATLTVDKDGCVSTYTHPIAVTAEVRANAGPDYSVCQGGSIVLDASDSQGNGYLWTVISGDPTSIDLGSTATNPTVSPLVTTTYKLQVDDSANNCTKVDDVTVFVDVDYNPIADAGGPTIEVCQGGKVTLDATGSMPPPAEPNASISYFWSPAQLLDDPTSATPMATITETTTFELVVITDSGCKDTASVEVVVVPCDVALEKTVSNATPNVGDVITFTITATNEGSLALSGIEIQDNVPSGYTAISNISDGGSVANSTVSWSGISLSEGGSSTFTFDAEVLGSGAGVDYKNTAQVTDMDQLDVDSTPDNDDGDQSEDDEDSASIVPNGSIWGDILEDTNDDGNGNTPIAGVTVVLKDAAGNVIATDVTDADGKYDFLGLAPGNYTVEESQPDGYDDVSDQDGSPDGDAGDTDGTIDNSISVTVNAGEADMDNDFVEELLTSIWGDVTEDTDGNGLGDAPIAGVTITLKDGNGSVVATDVTDADGKYDFVGLPAGVYTVEETHPDGYRDVSDHDESPDGDSGDSDDTVDNAITVTTTPGEADMDNDFVEEGLTSIWGDVTEDTDNDGDGDSPIAGVTITLKDANGAVVATDVTDADGKYDFVGLPAGTYTVEESQPDNFGDVSDEDESPDGDAGDNDDTVDNSITVTTEANEADMDNDFIEVKLASISGTVLEDTDGDGLGDTPIPGVTVTLKDENGNVVATDVTDNQGFYSFTGLTPGVYTLEETDLPGYEDVSDMDTNTPGDDTDGANDPQDDAIPVVLQPGESDDGNDFVERGLTSIWGDVTEDTNGDGIGDDPISGVTITLKDANGTVIDTDITDADGKYDFTGLPAGDYTVEETQPVGFADVSDEDESDDGDAGDNNTVVDNTITVTTEAGEADMDNDFIEEKLASIAGMVSEDIDNDDLGDRPLSGITIQLIDESGNVVATDVTDANGKYEFLNVIPGNYTLVQVQPNGYNNVSDEDGSPDPDGGNDPVDNSIPVVLGAGENDDDNDFIEEQLVSIGSTVFEDSNNSGTQENGERGISGVDVAAFLDVDADGLPDSATPVATDVTDVNGNYYLGGLEPGKYVVVAQAPAGLDHSSSFTGTDNGMDSDDNGDQPLGAGTPATSVTIMLVPDTEPTNESGAGGNQESLNGEQDNDGDMTIDFGFFGGASLGDFVWFDLNGDGYQDPGEPGLQGVTVNLLDENGNQVATTESGPNGEYSFTGLAPGQYVVEFVTPASYTEVVQMEGTTPDNNSNNSDSNPLNGQTNLINVNSGDAISGIDAGFNLLLEISLSSFTGRYVEDREMITLEWITSSEVNADYYIVERAFDHEEFIAIERVAAIGSINAEALYNHDDVDIAKSGLYSYRLIEVASDGTQFISDIVAVNVRKSFVTSSSVSVYPNPVYDRVNVDIEKQENDVVSVKLFDLTGKVMSMNSINIVGKGNSASIEISVQDLPRATYFLRVSVGDQIFTKKITLVK